ncbi:hypothetical protein A0J61_10249, partial [Choanephora cucurbitarum]
MSNLAMSAHLLHYVECAQILGGLRVEKGYALNLPVKRLHSATDNLVLLPLLFLYFITTVLGTICLSIGTKVDPYLDIGCVELVAPKTNGQFLSHLKHRNQGCDYTATFRLCFGNLVIV